MPGPSNESCKACYFWKEIQTAPGAVSLDPETGKAPVFGTCRRFPAYAYPARAAMGQDAVACVRPNHEQDDWCGEYIGIEQCKETIIAADRQMRDLATQNKLDAEDEEKEKGGITKPA